METSIYLSRLDEQDIPFLRTLEESTNLAFWGSENYEKLLLEFPLYFGFKAVLSVPMMADKPAGFYLARALFENLEILKIGVLLQFQRMGIGTSLMESAYAEGIRRGCSRCFLEVRKSNAAAIHFYETHTFRISGTRLNYYSNPVEDAWIMERPI